MTHNHHESKSKSKPTAERDPATDLSWRLRKSANDKDAKQRLTRPTETTTGYGDDGERILVSDPTEDRAWIMLTGESDPRVEIRR